jgi:hypothetical protein
MSSWSHLLTAFAAAGLTVGCSQPSAGTTAEGMVLLDDQPLAGATVQFWPKDDLTLGLAYSNGTTDRDGRFRLKSRDGPVLKPGRYIVLVKRLVKPDGTPPTVEEATRADPLTAWRNTLPELYSDKEHTPHNAVEIRPGHNDLPPLNLKSKP